MRTVVLAVARVFVKSTVVLAVLVLTMLGLAVVAVLAGIGGAPGAVVALLLVIGFVALVRREAVQMRRGR